jgi:methylmalonyl-CoA mutase N-terminal domain/subunit
MKERYSTHNPKSQILRFHAQTCGSTLTAQQPKNNVVRVAIQALAAVLGGAQSLHTNSFDEALALPSEEASRLALRTQQILAYESGLREVIDPLGGRYEIEWRTNHIETNVLKLLDTIDSMGGAVACLRNGFMKKEIEESAFQDQKKLESKEEIVVGMNAFIQHENPRIDLLKVSEKLETKRHALLLKYRSKREWPNIKSGLIRLTEKAKSDENLMPHIIDVVERGATLGEISDALREAFGTYDQ